MYSEENKEDVVRNTVPAFNAISFSRWSHDEVKTATTTVTELITDLRFV